jgi:hypothetical protein
MAQTAEQIAADKKRKQQQMLQKVTSKRIPRVVAAILSCKGLKSNNPTPAQVEQICDVLDKAVEEVEKYLKSDVSKSSFQLVQK